MKVLVLMIMPIIGGLFALNGNELGYIILISWAVFIGLLMGLTVEFILSTIKQ